jgi:hypothetical protein
MQRKPRNVLGELANLGLLERELGSLEYQLLKLPPVASGRAGLEAQKAQLVKALDAEHAKQTKARADRA